MEVFERMSSLLYDSKPTVVRQCLGALHEVILYRPEMADVIREALRQLSGNMTQESLAEKVKVSRQTISKWEMDAANPEMHGDTAAWIVPKEINPEGLEVKEQKTHK